MKPAVNARYRTTPESAVVGESLAGLFVVETFLLEPDLFDTYLAFDPSLWWNHRALLAAAPARLRDWSAGEKTLYFAASHDATAEGQGLSDALSQAAPASVHWHYEAMPEEGHATIYHPAALRAFQTVFKPAPKP